MAKGKKKLADDQGSRLPPQTVISAIVGREKKRLKAGKINPEKAVTFCHPPPLNHNYIHHITSPPIMLEFQGKASTIGDDNRGENSRGGSDHATMFTSRSIRSLKFFLPGQ